MMHKAAMGYINCDMSGIRHRCGSEKRLAVPIPLVFVWVPRLERTHNISEKLSSTYSLYPKRPLLFYFVLNKYLCTSIIITFKLD